MSNLPKLIWANIVVESNGTALAGEWNYNDVGSDDDTEYVRKDIAEPKVKPLEWVKHPRIDAWRCDTLIGIYKVFGTGRKPSWDFDGFSNHISTVADTTEAAFAAAQADYESRIFSVLETET